jgi:hypothetical protein
MAEEKQKPKLGKQGSVWSTTTHSVPKLLTMSPGEAAEHFQVAPCLKKTDEMYDYFENMLSMILPTKFANIPVGDVVFSMSAPMKVTIHDAILGVTEKILQILIIVWLAYEMFSLKQYNLVGVPNGYPQFFFERGTFNFERQKAFNESMNVNWPVDPNKKANCKTFENEVYGNYEYIQTLRDTSGELRSPVYQGGKMVKADGLKGISYFNDDKVRCKQLNFAEIYKKDASEGYVVTYQKETYSSVKRCETLPPTTKTDCNHPDIRQAPDTVSTIVPKADALETGKYHFPTKESFDYTSCTCLELRNYMAIAPEYVAVSFFHNYQTPQAFDGGLSGSSANKREGNEGKKHPDTFLRKKDPCSKDGCWVDVEASRLDSLNPQIVFTKDRSKSKFAAGQKIKLLVKSLIDIASVDPKTGEIDSSFLERSPSSNGPKLLKEGDIPGAPAQPGPARRIYGLSLNLDLHYDIQAADSWNDHATAECDLLVSFDDGKVEWSLDAQMHERQSFNDDYTDPDKKSYQRVYSELLNRGIMIRFNPMGKVAEFRALEMFNVIIQGLVLLPFATTIVMFFAKYVVPKKDLFATAVQSNVDYDREMSRFASQCLLSSFVFQQWAREKGSHELTGEDIVNAFHPSMGETAELFAKQILSADSDNTDVNDFKKCSIDLETLIDLMTPDHCNLAVLTKHCHGGRLERAMGYELERAKKYEEKESERRASKAAVGMNDVEGALDKTSTLKKVAAYGAGATAVVGAALS